METGKPYARGYLHKVLKNLFYIGLYQWGDTTYKGTHPLFVDPGTFHQVQEIFAALNRPKQRHHEFAFAGGLLRCAYSGQSELAFSFQALSDSTSLSGMGISRSL